MYHITIERPELELRERRPPHLSWYEADKIHWNFALSKHASPNISLPSSSSPLSISAPQVITVVVGQAPTSALVIPYLTIYPYQESNVSIQKRPTFSAFGPGFPVFRVERDTKRQNEPNDWFGNQPGRFERELKFALRMNPQSCRVSE